MNHPTFPRDASADTQAAAATRDAAISRRIRKDTAHILACPHASLTTHPGDIPECSSYDTCDACGVLLNVVREGF